jgi:hypothetical protein
MVGSSRESPGKRTAEKTSLFGLVSFQPHLAIVLIFLTLTLAVVGVRVSQDSGIRRVDDLVREALRAFAAPQKEDAGARDPADVEARVREWTGARIILPRDEELFAYTGFSREKMGRQTVAAVRFTFSGEPYLLMVVRREMIGDEGSPESLFSESGFLSGEKDGKAFVFWEREGVSYLLVTGTELEHAFDLVRRYFT